MNALEFQAALAEQHGPEFAHVVSIAALADTFACRLAHTEMKETDRETMFNHFREFSASALAMITTHFGFNTKAVIGCSEQLLAIAQRESVKERGLQSVNN